MTTEYHGKKWIIIEPYLVGLSVHTPQFVDWLSESLHESQDEVERLKKENAELRAELIPPPRVTA